MIIISKYEKAPFFFNFYSTIILRNIFDAFELKVSKIFPKTEYMSKCRVSAHEHIFIIKEI